MKTTAQKIREWFDYMEKSLEQEANQAGLYEHNTMIGSSREFLVKRVLKSILPANVCIGSGRIIDSEDNSSKQVDIIIYDSRFPVLEIESGIGMYLIESVIATIEVKSTLNITELKNALNNTLSILNLTVCIKPNRFIKDDRKLNYSFMPSSYVYAYNSRLSFKKMGSVVDHWFKEHEKPVIPNINCAFLPRLIIAGKNVGMLDDGFVQINPGEDVLADYYELYGTSPEIIMGFWKLNSRFGFLMVHLLHTIAERFGLFHHGRGVEYGIDHYIAQLDYFKTEIKGKLAFYSLHN